MLQEPLPEKAAPEPSSKKARTDTGDDTIEYRLAANSYNHVAELVQDLRKAQERVKKRQESDSTVAKEDVDVVSDLLSKYSDAKLDHALKISGGRSRPSQVLTVHSHVQGGRAQQLYTGLQLRSVAGEKREEIDATKLPNGFDVVEAAFLDAAKPSANQTARTFGEVFRPGRKVKSLEKPVFHRGTGNTRLSFAKPYENLPTTNKDDYRCAILTTGHWLDYAAPGVRTGSSDEADALFSRAFSSFAPTVDNSGSVVAHTSKSRQWYRKSGQHRLYTALPTPHEDLDFDESVYLDWNEPEEMSTEPVIRDAELEIPKVQDEDTDFVTELSELLQTLSSYQRLREVNINTPPDDIGNPSEPEQATYVLLRDQLKVLVAQLPPYLVSKLDGDQLAELNISTSIQLSMPEYSGTGQPDDYTLEEQRRILRQNTASVRPAAAVQAPTRNSYMGTTTPAGGYGAPARQYGTTGTATPSMPGYAQRAAQQQMYGTPKPNAVPPANNYVHTPVYQNRQPFPNATIQQFQRYQQNGMVTPPTQSSQTPYSQQRTQAPTSFQPSTHSNYSQQPPAPQYGRPSNPQPLANGHIQHQQRQAYTPNTMYPSTANLTGNPNATIQQVKAAQAQAQAHLARTRQGSGTPQPKEILPRPASAMSGISTNSQTVNGARAGTPVSNTNTGS